MNIPDTITPLHLTEDEWRARLTPEQYRIMRAHGTERACTSPLNDETRPGIYHCAACDLPLFTTQSKYESGTGWPSFFQPVASQVIGTSTDHHLGYPRTEVHCARCGGHLGHVFPDGPQDKTGLRYCLNGEALVFRLSAKPE